MRKKLIEVALPLEAINLASAREKSIRHGHPSTLHLWWARRPLAAARAVLFAQMVDDPSAQPEAYPTPEAQEARRQELFTLIEQLVQWENTTNEAVLERARAEIRRSWAWQCLGASAARLTDAEIAARLANSELPALPAFHDPFAGGGALPLEAQRLGLEAYASDLNPVAVLINKAMIEIPPKFAGKPPVNPEARGEGATKLLAARDEWRGARGLAEDVRYYGQWMRDEAAKRIGHLYPKIEITQAMVDDPAAPRPDLKPYVGQKLTVIAWLWARTVKSPNPAFAHVDAPLASTFMLSTKAGKEAYVEPVIERDGYRFVVKVGKPKDAEAAKNGTSAGKRAAFLCVMSGTPISYDYIRAAGQAGQIREKLMAIVAEGERGRVYLSPSPEHERVVQQVQPAWRPEVRLEGKCRVNVSNYGLDVYGDLFTPRQLVALTTFSDLVLEARARVHRDAVAAGLPDDGVALDAGGTGAQAYADAVAVYLAFGVDKMSDRHSTLGRWDPTPTASGVINTFSRQALPMTWDYAEGNPFSEASGNFQGGVGWITKVIELALSASTQGIALSSDAATQDLSLAKIVSTDPPYCLAPGTLIQTPEGYRPIEAIRVGDRVLTHAGRFAQVTRTYQRPYHGALYQLKVAHTSQALSITGDHPLYAVRTGACTVGYADYCHIQCTWMAQNGNRCSVRLADDYRLEWIPAREIRANDLIFMPTLQAQETPQAIDLTHWLPTASYTEFEGALHYQKATSRSLARGEAESALPRRYAAPAQVSLSPELCDVWWEGGYLLPIRGVTRVEYAGTVYNLETEDHSYVTAAGCVHNCDNIGYADLSDFFYVWLRRSLRTVFPALFATMAVPKTEELVSTPYRHGSKLEAETFFLTGMTQAMHCLAEQAQPAYPVTIYYAYKQAETVNAKTPGMTFTGWETFLDAVIQAGFTITGTWPIRTELGNRMIGQDTNALASSIVLVCRRRPADAPTAARREFVDALRRELPVALAHLQRSNIAPVDLQQAAIGPGMAVFTRYARVVDTAGRALSVREALALINATLDEVLAEQEGDFDADTRWALAWFDQFGFAEGEFGNAETLSKAKNTSVAGMVEAGIIVARAGKVRLLRPEELPTAWDPATDPRLTVWEMVHHLVYTLDHGEVAAAELAARLGSRAESARELAYRLYTICERKKRAAEALAYNALVQSWPEIMRLAQQVGRSQQERLL